MYEDTRGNLTGGVGHLLNASEALRFPLGASLTEDQIHDWLMVDTERAWNAAVVQSVEINCPLLAEALFAVCFQLGVAWHRVHVKTWALLMEGEWEEAAEEAADSLWFRQTPTRVRDFQDALRAL